MLKILKKYLIGARQADKYPNVPWLNRNNKFVYPTGVIQKRKRMTEDVTKL